MSSHIPCAPMHSDVYKATVSRVYSAMRGCGKKSEGFFDACRRGAHSLQVRVMESRGVVADQDDVKPLLFQCIGHEFFAGRPASQDDDETNRVGRSGQEFCEPLVEACASSRGGGDDRCTRPMPLKGDPDDVRCKVVFVIGQDEDGGAFRQAGFGALG